MTYPEAIAWLEGAESRGIQLGLGRMRALAGALGIAPAPAVRILHVAGTNGKGSVCAFLDRILREAGLSVGLYTSPHLVRFEERIRVGGKPLAPDDLAAVVETVRAAVEAIGSSPTFFELTTAVALARFRTSPLDAWVLETGMGGRLDATNIFTPAVSAITPIDLDHQQWLGDTLGEIAAEKAGILKPGVPAISAPQHPEARAVLESVAASLGTPIRFLAEPYRGGPVGLRGSTQRWNAALAEAAARTAFPDLPEEAIRAGIARAEWPGRFHEALPGTILDGAHNPAAAAHLAETWREEMGETQASVVLAVLRDKDAEGIAAALAPVAARFIATGLDAERCRPAQETAAAIRSAAPGLPVETAPDPASALRIARRHGEPVLVTGSLYLVGECMALPGDPPPQSE